MNEFSVLNAEAMEVYDRDGFFVLKGYLEKTEIETWEQTITQKFALQALKIGAIKEKLCGKSKISEFTSVEDIDQLIMLFEEMDKKAAYFASNNVAASKGARKFVASDKVTGLASKILDCPEHLLEIPIQFPALLQNIPGSKRLSYGWHTEHNYMPQRINFTNLWTPTFREKRDGNGTMGFRVGSHKRHYYHINVVDEGAAFKLRNIPEEQLKQFPPHLLNCEPGDLVVFHGNMVHRSTLNKTAKPSYATIIRIYDYRRDLTLSHTVNAGCGAEDYGREDLQIID